MRAALGPQGPQGEGQPAWGVGPASHEVPKGQKGEMSWSGNQVASAARCPLHTPASPQTALPLVTLPESTCDGDKVSAPQPDSPLASGPRAHTRANGAQQGHRVPSRQPQAFLQGPQPPRLRVSKFRYFTNSCHGKGEVSAPGAQGRQLMRGGLTKSTHGGAVTGQERALKRLRCGVNSGAVRQ